MPKVDVSITGIQELQEANAQLIAALQPDGALGKAIKTAVTMAHRGVVTRAHVDTGAMRAAQRMEVRGVRGKVFTDPGAVNPRSNARPAEYVVDEENRGGSHALYGRTVNEEGSRIVQAAGEELRRGLPR